MCVYLMSLITTLISIAQHSSAEAINAETDSQILTQLGAILIKVFIVLLY